VRAAGACVVGQVQAFDEFAHRGFGDALAAGQRLELLVGIGQAVAAHHGLHGLGQHFPGGVEVGGDRSGRDLELAQPLRQRVQPDLGVPERGAERPQHGGVGQVALPAADRQLFREVPEQGVGDAQVAFGVFEVDRVDLVRHGARSDLALLQLLPEVAERDVAPQVAAQVDQHDVRPPGRVAQLGDAVVRLDLGGHRVEGEVEAGHEAFGERGPVDVGIGGDMRVVVADRAVDLAGEFDRRDLRALALQACDHVRQFLAQGGGRGGLAVGARQHRLRGLGAGHVAQGPDHAVERGQEQLAALAQHQPVGEVVDVLAGAGEVDELQRRGQLGIVAQPLLDQVLDRLDVVVGGALDLLDPGRVRR
jgi:hypothetical protein